MSSASSQPARRIDRRRALQTLFCSSAALALNLRSIRGESPVDQQARHLLAIGDFGTTGEFQVKVAEAMRQFVTQSRIRPEGLLLLGDNFYSRDKAGFSVDSPRWTQWFEEAYPASHFPGPCWAILGNHDYHDNPGGEQVQLEYGVKKSTRWTMPAKWYRFDIGGPQPLLTVIALDSNLPGISGGKDKKTGQPKPCLTPREVDAQLAWLRVELATPRAPFTIVMGHHPLYSNGSHGDTPELIEQWGPLLQEHQVHLYLCGHDHDLQHLELQDKFTSFVLSGGGGARTRALKSTRRTPYGRDVYGFTHLELQPDRMTISHHGLQGEVLHRFAKHREGRYEIL